MPPLVKYSLIRVGLFVVVLAILLLVGVTNWIAAIAAALVALSVSYIFFRQQRDDAIRSVSKTGSAPTPPAAAGTDEQAEDN